MADSSNYAFDVFIAYAEADKQWVLKELLPHLKEARLKVCLDVRDFRPGSPRVREYERAVVESRKTLLILTPAFVESEWAELGENMAQTLDPASRTQRFIPLLKTTCDLPLRLKGLTLVDFVDPDSAKYVWTQLLTALGAPPPQETPQVETPRSWCLAHPYPMPPNFTGRDAERKALTHWLEHDADHPLLVMRALGGFGKSALTWHWLTHDVDRKRWPYVVWWSFYEADASFGAFVAETLIYFNVNPVALGPRQQIEALLTLLANYPVLLVLDGFERELRAFSSLGAAYQGDEETATPTPTLPRSQTARTGEGAASPSPVPPASAGRGRAGEGVTDRDCVSPLAEAFLRAISSLPNLRGKVVMTTRLRPRPVEVRGGTLLQGCTETELTQLHPEDAAAFFRAQGIRGSRAELENAGQAYGYHPLSLRLLAGLILTDLQQPGDIAAAQHLDVGEDLVQRQHHVLQVAYDRLSPQGQKLLGTIACFRSPVDYAALRTLATNDDGKAFDADVRDLIDRGWLHHDLKANRYDLHPIVRRYAYDRLTGDERTAAHSQLRNYFEAVPKLDKVQRLEDLTPVIELYHHTVRARQYDEARELYRDRLAKHLYYHFGAYQLSIELLRALFSDDGEYSVHLESESAQAWSLNELAKCYALSGQPRRSISLFEVSNTLDRKRDNLRGVAIGLANVANRYVDLGMLKVAESKLHAQIDLCREIGFDFQEAIGHRKLGRLLAFRGLWEESANELATALAMLKQQNRVQPERVVWSYYAVRSLLMARKCALFTFCQETKIGLEDKTKAEAFTAARNAYELMDRFSKTSFLPERDYVHISWLLGTVHHLNGAVTEADRYLSESLERCRRINAVEVEANILIDLARLRLDQGDRDEARRLAQEALTIAERSEYVLNGADANLVLARIALADGDWRAAKVYAREAKRLATCDGVSADGNYTYKVAYEEAEAMLNDK